MIRLGTLCRDTVTDFAGTATARCEYLCGTTHYRLEDEAGLDGVERARWFEEGRIEPVHRRSAAPVDALIDDAEEGNDEGDDQ